MHRDDMTPESRRWCDANGIEFDDDGNLKEQTVPPGAPQPCTRCGVMCECGTPYFASVSGRTFEGVNCTDCQRIMRDSLRAWASVFTTEAE